MQYQIILALTLLFELVDTQFRILPKENLLAYWHPRFLLLLVVVVLGVGGVEKRSHHVVQASHELIM